MQAVNVQIRRIGLDEIGWIAKGSKGRVLWQLIQ
jgi:hypothetical protein